MAHLYSHLVFRFRDETGKPVRFELDNLGPRVDGFIARSWMNLMVELLAELNTKLRLETPICMEVDTSQRPQGVRGSDPSTPREVIDRLEVRYGEFHSRPELHGLHSA